MANSAIMLTGQSGITSGNLPFLFYESINQTKPQPLIVFLHGAGEGSPTTGTLAGQHNTVTVRMLEQNGVGLMNATQSANLPTFVDPISQEAFDYFMIAPQQYYPAGTDRGNGITWPQLYIDRVIDWAIANRNIDVDRIYLTGLSLGGGGTISMCLIPSVRAKLAAAAAACPGYGNGTSLPHAELAKSGFPIWIVASFQDTVPQGTNTVCAQIVKRINSLTTPLLSPKFYWYDTPQFAGSPSSAHAYAWACLYNQNDGATFPGHNGIPCVHNLSMFRWFLKYKRAHDLPFIPSTYS